MDPSDRLIESLGKYNFYKPSHCEQNDNFGFKNSNVQNHSNGHNTSKVISKISVKSVLKYFHFFLWRKQFKHNSNPLQPKFKCSNRIVLIFIVKDHSTMEFKSSRNSPTAWPRSRNVTTLLIYDFTCLILVTMKLTMLRVKLREKHI